MKKGSIETDDRKYIYNGFHLHSDISGIVQEEKERKKREKKKNAKKLRGKF